MPHDPDLPNVRILSFGYAAFDAYYVPEPQNTGYVGGIMTFSEQLCYDLRNIRGDLEELDASRPIIFVGHGIGGLVIKKALVENEDIRQYTSNILFFNTPHQGFDCQEWEALNQRTMNEEAEIQFSVGSHSLSELHRHS